MCGGGGGWGHERRQGEMMEGVEGGDGWKGGSELWERVCEGVCGAGTADKKRSGVVGAAEVVRRVLLARRRARCAK